MPSARLTTSPTPCSCNSRLTPGLASCLPSLLLSSDRSVTALIRSAVRADKPAYKVRMHGDDDLEITVDYYFNKHPRALVEKAEIYLTHPAVRVLYGKPPTA